MHDIDVRNSHTGGASRRPSQGAEGAVLLLDARDVIDLRGRVAHVADAVGRLSGDGGDGLAGFAAVLNTELSGGPVRSAVVATSTEQAVKRLARLLAELDAGRQAFIDVTGGVFLGRQAGPPRIGFLFPGQGSGRADDGSALATRFDAVQELFQRVTIPADEDPAATSVAQPRIVRSSVAGLRVLSLLGIEGWAAVGHSLGELTALHWAGALTEDDLIALATARGQIMTWACAGDGAMAGMAAAPADVRPLLAGTPVVIAGYNGPKQTVVAGPAPAIDRVCAEAAAAGIRATRLAVSDAFHSPAMAPAADALRAYLTGLRMAPLAGRVISTVTGDVLADGADLTTLLVSQLCEPVRFTEALGRLAAEVTALIEVGPGRVLSGLATRCCPDIPVIPLITDADSLGGLLTAAAAGYVLGAAINPGVLSQHHDPDRKLARK